jgi:hypothetical protein
MTMIVTIIALLAFLVCWGFCFKTMRWFHVVVALLVMGTGCWHLVQLSTVLKTRSAWMKMHYELKTRRDSLEVEQKRLISGAVDKVTEERDNIQDLDSMLTRLLIDQGRVWKQTTPEGVQNQAFIVDTGFQPVNNEALQISENTVFYVFKEDLNIVQSSTGKPIPVPVKYLGEYRVSAAVTGAKISLQPAPITDPRIAAPHANDGSTWTLYEKMPVDGHRLFSETDIFDTDIKHKLDENAAPLFGAMDEAKIRQAFERAIANSPDLQMGQQDLDAYVKMYMGDGRVLLQDESVPFEHQWVKLQFNQNSNPITVDSDAAQAGLNESFYDPSGMAVVPQLRRGDQITFQKGDIGLFHLRSEKFQDKPIVPDAEQLTAEDGQGNSVATQLTAHYVRPPTDYTFFFHDNFQRRQRAALLLSLYQDQNRRFDSTLTLALAHIQVRTTERDRLTTDLTNQTEDRDTAQRFADQLSQEREALRIKLADLFDQNQQLTLQLAEIQATLEAEINKRTNAVGNDSE